MATRIVFQNNLIPEQLNLSDRFINATAFIVSAPLITAELEIDCYLQVYIPAITGEIARVVNLGKISEQAIYLNIADTEVLSVIPSELLDTGLEMALAFVPSDSTFIQATIITKDCSVCTELAAMRQEIDFLRQQNDLILNSLGVVAPVSSGLSNAQFQTQYLVGVL